jgi:hypothetical protein
MEVTGMQRDILCPQAQLGAPSHEDQASECRPSGCGAPPLTTGASAGRFSFEPDIYSLGQTYADPCVFGQDARARSRPPRSRRAHQVCARTPSLRGRTPSLRARRRTIPGASATRDADPDVVELGDRPEALAPGRSAVAASSWRNQQPMGEAHRPARLAAPRTFRNALA